MSNLTQKYMGESNSFLPFSSFPLTVGLNDLAQLTGEKKNDFCMCGGGHITWDLPSQQRFQYMVNIVNSNHNVV